MGRSKGGWGGLKQPETDSDPLNRVYELIQAEVQKAVRTVANLDPQWTEADICKRLNKYFYKAAAAVMSTEVPHSWDALAKEFVEAALMPVGNSCNDAGWFLGIDLEDAVLKVAVMAINAVMDERPPREEVEDAVLREYDLSMGRMLLAKGIWESVATAFHMLEDKPKNRIYQHLTKAYWTALDAAVSLDGTLLEHSDEAIVVDQWMVRLLIGPGGHTLRELEAGRTRIHVDQSTMEEGYSIVRIGQRGAGGDPGVAEDVRQKIQEFQSMPQHREKGILFGALDGDDGSASDLRRVHTFYRYWVTESMNKCWGVAEDSLTPEVANALFELLVAPFGERHPFTCVPEILIHRIGAPPAGWPFVSVAVQEFFGSSNGWGGEPAAKRRKKGKRGGDWNEDWKGQNGQETAANENPHPLCTSGADCVGSPEDSLIQHILEGTFEDKYCETCWNSFVARNPDLEGVPVDGVEL